MKSIVPVLCCISLLGLPASAAANKNPYYRQRGPGGVVPRQNGSEFVVNAASFEPGVSPGELATIFGRDLTSVSGIVVATALPLPTRLDGVTVVVDGIEAPIYSIAFAKGEDQISFQVPFETPTGPGAAEILVFDSGVQTADFLADSFTEDPGIFVYNGNVAVAVHPSHWTLVTRSNPAARGEIVVLYYDWDGPSGSRRTGRISWTGESAGIYHGSFSGHFERGKLRGPVFGLGARVCRVIPTQFPRSLR